MNTQRPVAILSERVGGSVSALFELIRQKDQRKRNLTELQTLDAERLQDIGLSEDARARIVRSN